MTELDFEAAMKAALVKGSPQSGLDMTFDVRRMFPVLQAQFRSALAARDAQLAEAVEALEYLTGNRGHTGPSCVRTPNGGPAITPDEFCAVCRGYSTLARLRSR